MKKFILRTYLSAATFALLIGCSSNPKSKSYSGYGLQSISPETLARYAPPTPKSAIKNQIEKLVDIRSPSAGVITSDGKKLFVNWTVTGSNQIWRLDGPNSFPTQITGGEDRSNLVGMSPDNKWLVVSRDNKGDENYGIFLLSAAGGELKTVYYNSKYQTSYQGFSEDSRGLYYTSNNLSPDSYVIYYYDIASGKSSVVWDKPGIWSLSDHLGERAILSKHNGSMHNEHFLLNLKTKEATPLIGQNEIEDFSVLLSAKSDEYYVLTNKVNDFRAIYLLKNNKLAPYISVNNADVDDMSMSRDRHFLAYTINKDGYAHIHLLQTSNKKEIPILAPKNSEQAYWGSFSPNSRYITFAIELFNSPRKNYVFDLKTRKSTEWVHSSTPEVNTLGYVKAELMTYPAEDGTPIPMFVWRSQACKTKTCPVIINFHGGPESQSQPRFNPIINLYVDRGFVYIQPNVRGSDGYGKKWLRADNGANRLKVITDIRDAARFVKKNMAYNGVVPKVGITGGSYGGYSTLVGASMFADDYDASFAIVGMSSLITFIENTAPYRRALRANEYGEPKTDREFMLKLSPVSYIDKVRKPLLIAHGATDPRVPVGEAVQFHETVQQNNKDASLIIFPDEGHGVSKRPNIVLLNSYTVDFFERYLK
ncbi:MAG: S9 family peptidase [Bdellovibrionaceae bacterium]|nr:S9 family peptidase [Pseudobdellovibrionaceae bacterium]